MTDTTNTPPVPVYGLPALPEGCDRVVFRAPKKGEPYWCRNAVPGPWILARFDLDTPHLVATISGPWYPPSWLDANGNLLPDVYEHTPGTWPQCGPDDEVQWLLDKERRTQKCILAKGLAANLEWRAFGGVVAYRVLRRAKESQVNG